MRLAESCGLKSRLFTLRLSGEGAQGVGGLLVTETHSGSRSHEGENNRYRTSCLPFYPPREKTRSAEGQDGGRGREERNRPVPPVARPASGLRNTVPDPRRRRFGQEPMHPRPTSSLSVSRSALTDHPPLFKTLLLKGPFDPDRGGQLQRVKEEGTHLARATLILQPPLKSFSFLRCMAGVKPSPCKIREALISALSASSSSRRS